MKIKLKAKSATIRPKALPSKASELRGWSAIARFLGMPDSTAHRWAKEGMPVRREGRNVVASPEELNEWLQRTSGEAVSVHVVTPGSDLLKDLRASLAVQKSSRNSRSQTQERAAIKSWDESAQNESVPYVLINDQRQWLLFPRDDNPQRENRMLVVTSRCIQPFADGDESMQHGRASQDTVNSGLRSECLPAIS